MEVVEDMCSGPLVRALCSGRRAGPKRRCIVARSGPLVDGISLKRRCALGMLVNLMYAVHLELDQDPM